MRQSARSMKCDRAQEVPPPVSLMAARVASPTSGRPSFIQQNTWSPWGSTFLMKPHPARRRDGSSAASLVSASLISSASAWDPGPQASLTAAPGKARFARTTWHRGSPGRPGHRRHAGRRWWWSLAIPGLAMKQKRMMVMRAGWPQRATTTPRQVCGRRALRLAPYQFEAKAISPSKGLTARVRHLDGRAHGLCDLRDALVQLPRCIVPDEVAALPKGVVRLAGGFQLRAELGLDDLAHYETSTRGPTAQDAPYGRDAAG